MEIRKNNDIKFQISLVDHKGNPIQNIKDVKCTLINSGALSFCWPHDHYDHCALHHPVMCGYNHPYNVHPVNCIHTHHHKPKIVENCNKPGTEVLPLTVDVKNAMVYAYFAADKQFVLGKYKMVLEVQIWDQEWADKGVRINTVQLDDVCELVAGDNSQSNTPYIIEKKVVMYQDNSQQGTSGGNTGSDNTPGDIIIQGVPEAPFDGKSYNRKDGSWVVAQTVDNLESIEFGDGTYTTTIDP